VVYLLCRGFAVGDDWRPPPTPQQSRVRGGTAYLLEPRPDGGGAAGADDGAGAIESLDG
jgi:hypothetical protein